LAGPRQERAHVCRGQAAPRAAGLHAPRPVPSPDPFVELLWRAQSLRPARAQLNCRHSNQTGVRHVGGGEGPARLGEGAAPAAHQETTMGKMPAQMVTSGTAMNTGVVTAPTRYDHTPVQYITRSHHGSSRWNSGQCRLERIIWKCLRAAHAARLVACTRLHGGPGEAGRLVRLATGTQHPARCSTGRWPCRLQERGRDLSLNQSRPWRSYTSRRGRACNGVNAQTRPVGALCGWKLQADERLCARQACRPAGC